MKDIAKIFIPQKIIRNIRNNRIIDSEKELVCIHIGKCGGATIWDAINKSNLIKEQFSRVHKVHISKPPILSKTRYLVVIRNPISRVVSAFNWRYKLVVEDGAQQHRFRGEREILEKYKTLNAMAEALYTNGKVNKEVEKEFQKIHHIKESIEFYLRELLQSITAEQLFGVLSTETLSEDVMHQLAISDMERTHENAKYVDESKKVLSDIAHNNLKQYLSEDYSCLKRLIELKTLTVCDTSILLR